MDIELSVIIPVYNVEEYLEQCVNSILVQLTENSEMIIVNDGSTDGSAFLCDKIKMMDKRIRVIHKENGGVSSARNKGMELAQGKYITFIDPDDFVGGTMFYDMIECAEKNKVDLVECGFSSFYNQNDYKESEKKRIGYLSKEQAQKFFLVRDNTISLFCWAKLFKKKVIGDLKFEESLRIGEDALFVFEYMKRMQRGVFVLPNCFYKYRIRNNSAVGNVYTRKKKEDVESALKIKAKCDPAMKDEGELYFALTVFYAFSSLLNTTKWIQLYAFKDDYTFYKNYMRSISSKIVKRYSNRSTLLLWNICRFNPILYKMTRPIRKGRGR